MVTVAYLLTYLLTPQVRQQPQLTRMLSDRASIIHRSGKQLHLDEHSFYIGLNTVAWLQL